MKLCCRRGLRQIGTFALFFVLAFEMVHSQENTERFTAAMNRIKEAFNAGDFAKIGAEFNANFRQALPPEKSMPFFKKLLTDHGKIRSVAPPRYVPPNQAIFLARFERDSMDIKIFLDSQDKLAGLGFFPPAPAPPVSERNQTELSLPFFGRWLVHHGGDTPEQNAHHHVPNQRFAFDLIGADESGQTKKGDGLKNEDHFAFGREVLAPADGFVTEAIDGVRDNAPGSTNPYSALGNAVFIQHREGEVSVLAHLKQGSIRVKAGDKVTKGQAIGLCGNSGNSTQPHLHYHLQNTPVIQDGTGIKCFFQNVRLTREGKTESQSNYSPVKGDVVEP